MTQVMKLAIAGALLYAVVGCTTPDKGAVPADTATAQATPIAPPSTSGPVISAAPDTTVAPVTQPARPKTTGSAPKTSAPKSNASSASTPPMRDSAFKPKATVDANGNIQPIKRDSQK